jgi:hypothetical protein
LVGECGYRVSIQDENWQSGFGRHAVADGRRSEFDAGLVEHDVPA